MADLTLVIEDGSGVTGANTYITLEEADQYVGERVHARDWDGYDELHRTRAILTAFDVLNQLNWYGTVSTTTQECAWPRTGVAYHGAGIAGALIPTVIKKAQARLARRLAQRDRLEGVDQAPVVGASNAGRSRSLQTGHPASSSVIPEEVWGMIAPLVNLHSVALVAVG